MANLAHILCPSLTTTPYFKADTLSPLCQCYLVRCLFILLQWYCYKYPALYNNPDKIVLLPRSIFSQNSKQIENQHHLSSQACTPLLSHILNGNTQLSIPAQAALMCTYRFLLRVCDLFPAQSFLWIDKCWITRRSKPKPSPLSPFDCIHLHSVKLLDVHVYETTLHVPPCSWVWTAPKPTWRHLQRFLLVNSELSHCLSEDSTAPEKLFAFLCPT